MIRINSTSAANDSQTTLALETKSNDVFLPPPQPTPHIRRQLDDLLREVADVIAPVWPLKDYVAVNPYAGLAQRTFMDAHGLLQLVSDCETLMPLEYFAQQFRQQEFAVCDIETAIAELAADHLIPSGTWSATSIVKLLKPGPTNGSSQPDTSRHLRTIAQCATYPNGIDWAAEIRAELGKFCAAHYDDGQSAWRSPWQHMTLFQEWRSAASIDRNIEILGITGIRALVNQLPHQSDAAIVYLLNRLGVPEQMWQSFLLCQAFSVPGWSAWTKYQTDWTDDQQATANDLAGLLAMRLAYDVGLSEAMGINMDWESLCHRELNQSEKPAFRSNEAAAKKQLTVRYILQRASEIAYRNDLLRSVLSKPTDPGSEQQATGRQLAQMVFCIDVRSERIRRHLESQSNQIETFGFAGFFGMPLEFVPLGQTAGDSHVPVLLKPEFKLHEGFRDSDQQAEGAAQTKRNQIRNWRKLWKGFQSSAAGCFSFVETTGIYYAWKLLIQAAGYRCTDHDSRYDGLQQVDQDRVGPMLRSVVDDGIASECQVDLAAAMLTNLGLTNNFARLVVFCGHTSQTQNNPLAAGLDCGACGGHSGQPNAQMAAMLLNDSSIRAALVDRGISIPADTHFMAAVHNTTTDHIEWLDQSDVPASHSTDFRTIRDWSASASDQTRLERMPTMASESVDALLQRAIDWSEVRPEWGLTGNAAMIVGPRSMTKQAMLDGRTFLHSYDYQRDPEGTVLETIMTAPMVVAHWINMQYYASVVDNDHFGSGDKMIHNVVGRFGILSGGGGDLMTGLPWQSLHTGESLQHKPLRLQVVIVAPPPMIDRVIQQHPMIETLLANDWLQLIAIETNDGTRRAYRYSDSSWDSLAADNQSSLR